MFGSLSNWVNENVPKPTMPSMPAMPTVSMPTMPTVNVPFLNKNKDGSNEENPESTVAAENTNETNVEEVKTEVVEENTEAQTEQVAEDGKVQSNEEQSTEQDEEGKSYKPLESAKDFGKNMGSMLYSFGSKATSNVRNATTSIKDVIQKKTIIGDFAKENEKFINEKKDKLQKEDAAVLPWIGYNQEEKLKEQILELSSDSRNFLRPPPTGVDFQFDFNQAYPVAMAILEEDAALSEMRFKLVPKQIKEENFWLNYFYRVSLIKQSTQLEELNNPSEKEASKHDTVEFVSDSYNHDLNDEDIKNELKQLNLNNKKQDDDDIDDAEWDIKPEEMDNISPEELEKEINSMLN